MKLTPGELLQLKKMASQDPAEAGPGWQALSEAQTALARPRTGDKPLTVLTAPGASPDAPGVCALKAARILLDGDLLPTSPENLDPSNAEHRKALSTLHGVFVHECGHARHTPEERPEWEGQADDVLQATVLLEEIRMEAQVVRNRPEDAEWLRASAKNIILDDKNIQDIQGELPSISATVLIEGRCLAGSLHAEDTEEVEKLTAAELGDTRKEILEICKKAVKIEDSDGEGLVRLGAELAKLFPSDSGGSKGEILKAIEESLEGAAAEAGEGSEIDELLSDATARREIAESILESALTTAGAATGQSPGKGEREATPEERKARNDLSEKLKRVRWRERTKVDRNNVLPPGRLRTREALRRSAEVSRGKLPTAKPWKRTVRRSVPLPKLTCGVLVDTSGSMYSYREPLAGSLWALAHAVHDNGGSVAGALFGDTSEVIFPAGKPPRHVVQIEPSGGTDWVRGAVEMLHEELGWQREEGPRLLAILSDGWWNNAADAESVLLECREKGITVIQIGIGAPPPDHGADQVISVASASDLAPVLGEAAVREMRVW